MKRDLELIRELLRDIEKSDEILELSDFDYPDKTTQEVAYHLEMLDQAGYITANFYKSWGNSYEHVFVYYLNCSGHDFLDSIRDKRIWDKTKDVISKFATSATLDVIKRVSSEIAFKAIAEHI